MSFRASFCGFPYLEYVPDEDKSSSVNHAQVQFSKEFCCISDYISYLRDERKSVVSDLNFYSEAHCNNFYVDNVLKLKLKEIDLLISKFEKLLNDFIKEN